MDNIENEQGCHKLTSDEKLKAWGYGEWVEEPEIVTFSYKGFKCGICRNHVFHESGYLELGNLNGYIMIPKDHPWCGKDYDDIPCECHGGLTFSELNAQDEYWIGFDCGHNMDIVPSMEVVMSDQRKKMAERFPNLLYMPFFQPSYKNVNFVKQELIKIVDQAIAAKINV